MISSAHHSGFSPSHWFACGGKKAKPKPPKAKADEKSAQNNEAAFLKSEVSSDRFESNIQASVEAKACIAAIIERAENGDDLEPLFSQWKNHPEFTTILLKSHAIPTEPVFWAVREEMVLFLERQLDNGNDALLHRILDDLSHMKVPPAKLEPLLDTLARGVVRSTSVPQVRWEWAQAFEHVAQDTPTHTIEEFSKDMMAEKQTSRHLDAYQERLKIPSNALEKLHKHSLCLVGGGYSRIKADLREYGVKCQVTNIDPICTRHDPENEDTKLPQNFCEPGILDKLNRHGFAEVWALHSLPQYAMSPTETLRFYQNALSLLKPKGTLRVTPATGFKESFNASMQLSRPIVSKTSDKIIKALEGRPDLFQVSHHQPNTKSLFGKLKMHGVNITLVGSAKNIDAFLQNELSNIIKPGL
jgi:hypothetical protein